MTIEAETSQAGPADANEAVTGPEPVRVPSPEFWAITPFRITPPEGWLARPTVDQLVYMHVPDEPTTNLGLIWKRMPRSITLQQVSAMQMAVITKRDPNAVNHAARFSRIAGLAMYLRLTEFERGEGRGRVAQVHACFHGPFIGEDHPAEVFQIIAHFDVENHERSSEIQGAIDSFRFELVLPASAESPTAQPPGEPASEEMGAAK